MTSDMTMIPAIPAGVVARQELGAQQIARSAELAAQAVAAQARAVVEARCVMAERHPRDWDVVREKFLRECQRPGLARLKNELSCEGIYRIKRGQSTIEGPTIRLAEIAMRCMGNLLAESRIIFEDAQQRLVHVSVIDLETNVGPARDIAVPKTVERKRLAEGQAPISQRINSYGEMVFLVPATDDQIAERQGALESKALRTLLLRLFPGDILEEGFELIRANARKGAAAEDPDMARRRLLAAFAAYGVKAADLATYLGHSLDGLAPAEHEDLLAIHASLKSREATWAEILESRTGATPARPPASTGELAAELEKKRAAKAEPRAASEVDVESLRAAIALASTGAELEQLGAEIDLLPAAVQISMRAAFVARMAELR